MTPFLGRGVERHFYADEERGEKNMLLGMTLHIVCVTLIIPECFVLCTCVVRKSASSSQGLVFPCEDRSLGMEMVGDVA